MPHTITDTAAAIALISDHYSPLSDECRAELGNNCRLLSFDKGEILVRDGQYADKIYFIIRGSARAYYLKNGRDITDWFAFENEFISAINSFFMDIPSPHFIELTEPVVLLEISRETVSLLSGKYHDFERLGSRVVTKTMLQLQQRVMSLQFETAQQKYENLIALREDITLRIPLMHIASFLGITLETLSRIRSAKRRI